MEVTRIFDILPYHEARFKPKDDVIASKENGDWVKYRYNAIPGDRG